MGWNFRKRATIAPGIKLNWSNNGISATIGPKGASFNISKKGIYGNLSLPGTGLYKREKIYGTSNKKKSTTKRIETNPIVGTPEYVAISSLLKYKDVIEPNTLGQLQAFLDKGENYVYVEPGVMNELRRLHNAKHAPVTTETNIESTPIDEPSTTEAVVGCSSILLGIILCIVARVKFDLTPFPCAVIAALPLSIVLLISKYRSK